jgi:hypothetical protein
VVVKNIDRYGYGDGENWFEAFEKLCTTFSQKYEIEHQRLI